MRRASLILALILACSAPAAARDDLTLIVTRDSLQRLFTALCPVTVSHALTGGLPVKLAITFRRPRLRFEPGDGRGRIRVDLEYEINSYPPLIKGLKGGISPKLGLSFDARAGVLRVKVENFHLDLGPTGRIQMDNLLPPLSVPLGQMPRLAVGNRRVKVTVTHLAFRVTPEALIVRARLRYRGGFAP
jgi:hypothetical protein